jgi:hypothetical protein
LANQCHSISAFIHLSNLQQFNGNGWKASDEKYLYPLQAPQDNATDVKSANSILNEIMETSADGIQYNDYRSIYSNPYLFSKSLAEHILVDQVLKNKANGTHQLPIAIMRVSPVGPSVQEPLIGWVKCLKIVISKPHK